MSCKKLDPNYKIENFLNVWRNVYCLFVPIIATVAFFLIYCLADIKVWGSENFPDTLSSIITFVSIIISFFGVLLTLLITAKEQSEFIQFFLDSADKDAFVASIKRLIMCGLLTVIVAACLFMIDIMSEEIIVALLCSEVFTLIRFTSLTYRFTNILLMLFIRDKNEFKKKEGAKLEPDKKREMDERIRNGV